MDAPMLDAALRYADLGYKVFPCAPGRKTPLTKRGFLDATIDFDQIEAWWSDRPNANVAIASEGLLVVDVDQPEFHWLIDELDRRRDLEAAPQARTPRGGWHFFFRQAEGSTMTGTQGVLAPKVDTRANGGYVLVAPSKVAGKPYIWVPGLELDQPPDRLVEPPAWLVEALANPGQQRRPSANSRPTTPTLAHVAAGSPTGNPIPEGQRNATLARLGGAMRRVGMGRAEIIAALRQANADRCTPPLADEEVERVATSVARYVPDQISVAVAEDHFAQRYAVAAPMPPSFVDPGPIPDELLHVPGFVDLVADYTMRTAPYPERALAFCGALALQAFLAGRKVKDATGSRTNLYLLGLANTGAGKDHPRHVNQQILLEAGLAHCLGESFARGEGIEDKLLLSPAMLFQTDEIDGLITKINLSRDARYESIVNVLLKMFTSARSVYPMRVKAGKDTGNIDQPSVTIYGTAIPQNYYESLSLKRLTNGFFSRLVVVEAGRRGSGQDGDGSAIPEAVIANAKWWADFQPGERGNLSQWHPQPILVLQTDEARPRQAAFRAFADEEYAKAEAVNHQPGMASWSRANEKARRLALVYACSANREQPVIDAHAVQWACQFIEHQTRRMLCMAAGHVSENEFDARCKKLLGSLRVWRDRHGDEWMPLWQLSRKHPWSPRDHDEVRASLLSQQLIEYSEVRTGGPPQRRYRLKPPGSLKNSLQCKVSEAAH